MRNRGAFVYAAGLLAYLVAVTQRTTIGVAGVAATERFHADAAVLSMLAVLQLVVYAGAQVPLGVLLDRFGARRLMLAGTALMGIGQLVVALSPTIGTAIAGRVLVGAGDATIWISLVRLLSSWFPGRRVPVLTQWCANAGALGQVISSVPFAALLHESGWTTAFVSAAAFAVVGFAAVFLAVFDHPAGAPAVARPENWAQSFRLLGESLRRPGTQLGFWSHFLTMSPGTVFQLLWGVPYLVYALGYPRTEAAALLTVPVVAGVVGGPIIGVLTGRHPLRRSSIVLFLVFLMAASWAALLIVPGRPPFVLVLLMLVTIGIGGPGSTIGFDFARTFNPVHSLGSANGIVNVGGFSATFLMMFVMGLILDAAHDRFGQQMYSLDSFRVAYLVQFIVFGVGLVGLLRARGRTRRRMLDEEGIRIAPLWVALSEALTRKKATRS